jgi:hypothetical protein
MYPQQYQQPPMFQPQPKAGYLTPDQAKLALAEQTSSIQWGLIAGLAVVLFLVWRKRRGGAW